MKKVRIGIVGVGGMGSSHAKTILSGKISRCELTAVCDINPKAMEPYNGIKKYANSADLIRSGDVDAVIVATPHYAHTTVGIDVLKNKLHLLVEKPISVHKEDCRRLIAAHKGGKQVFAAMFNQRTDPHYREVKKIIDEGSLGEITRVNWIITDWFRSEAYYSSGSWRATWAGEGGGVLLNQCPHNLDLMQWLCGMPSKMRAVCAIGKKHSIEVEDEVTAYMEYPNGATGVFITSTGEAPGTNRLEICGENGKVTVEKGRVIFVKNEVPASEFCKTTKQPFARPKQTVIDIQVSDSGGQHAEIKQNFVDAILDGKPLIAPARDGIKSVEMANAMLLSSMTGKTVDLPINGDVFEKMLKKLIKNSKFVKNVKTPTGPVSLEGSFGGAK